MLRRRTSPEKFDSGAARGDSIRCVSLSRNITESQVLIHYGFGNWRSDAAAAAAVLDNDSDCDAWSVERCKRHK